MPSFKRHLWSAAFVMMVLCAIGQEFLNIQAIARAADKSDQKETVVDGKPAGKSKSLVHLYFSDKENTFLMAEERSILHGNGAAEMGKAIIEALIQGPGEGLMRTVPATTTLRSLYVTQDKTAYVDLSPAIRDAHPGGVYSEQMTIFSIVNSLILNIPEIDAVKILIDGYEAATLAGHMDLRYAFKANMLIIR